MRFLKGSSDAETTVAFGIVALFVIGILWLFGFNFWMTNEGTVKYDDCRQVINLNEGDWQTYFHKFTCNTFKTKSGITMSGECVSIETNSSLFSSGSSCVKAYVYEEKQGGDCNNPSYPYLWYDDQCHSIPQ